MLKFLTGWIPIKSIRISFKARPEDGSEKAIKKAMKEMADEDDRGVGNIVVGLLDEVSQANPARNWDAWLADAPIAPKKVQALLRKYDRTFKYGGPYSGKLVEHGLTPESILRARDMLELLFERAGDALTAAQKGEQPPVEVPPPAPGNITVDYKNGNQFVCTRQQATSEIGRIGVPERTAEALLDWFQKDVLPVKPDFLGYRHEAGRRVFVGSELRS